MKIYSAEYANNLRLGKSPENVTTTTTYLVRDLANEIFVDEVLTTTIVEHDFKSTEFLCHGIDIDLQLGCVDAGLCKARQQWLKHI